MSKVDLQIAVARPAAEVYAALADLARRPALDPTVTEIDPPDEPLREAAVFSGRGGVTGKDTGFEAVVTGLQEDRFLGFLFNYANGAQLFEEWSLMPAPSGTFIHYHAELLLPSGFIGKLLDRIVVGSGFRKQRETVLSRVKQALEAEPA